jgi:hypothetical protein
MFLAYLFLARGMNHGRIFFKYFERACCWLESCNLSADDYCLAAFVFLIALSI